MDRFNTPWRVTSAAIYTTPTDSRVYGTQIGKLARGIKRNFRKPEWLDEIPVKELENSLFQPRD